MKIRTLVIALAFACAAFAQTSTDPLPQFLFGTGETFSPYAATTSLAGKTSTIGTFAVRVSDTKLYSWSSLQMVPGVTSGAILTTGAGYVALQQGKFSLVAIGQAGISTTPNVTLGTFSGGGAAFYLLNAPNKIYLTAGMTVVGVSGNTVQPSFGIGIAKGF